MVTIIPIPTATASAATQDVVVELTESLCKKLCVNSASSLSGDVSFSAGTPTVLNGIAVVPITATGTVVVGSGNCSCGYKTRHFNETFDIAFTATTVNTVTLTVGANTKVTFTDVSCCHTSKVKLTATLNATIA